MEGRPPNEAELVARAKRGDRGAYESLVEEHQTIAFRTAYLITGSAADAEDAAQDAFVKAHAALRRFRPEASFRPWLLTIVANEARNRRRAARRRAELALRAAEEPSSGGAASSPEAAPLAARGRRHALGRGAARDRLPLLPRALRGGDGGRDRPAAGNRQVAFLARARTSAGAPRGGGGMTELEHALLDLGRTLELPATPDIAASVSRRLAAAETVRPRRLGRRRLVLVFAALVIAVGRAFAVPPASSTATRSTRFARTPPGWPATCCSSSAATCSYASRPRSRRRRLSRSRRL